MKRKLLFILLTSLLFSSCGGSSKSKQKIIFYSEGKIISEVEVNSSSFSSCLPAEDPIKEGYSFSYWTYNNAKIDENTALPKNDVIYVYAHFDINEYTLSVNCDSEKGTVSGVGSYQYFKSVTINVTPKAGYTFTGLYENNTLISNATAYTFYMPSHDVNYEARFVGNAYNISFDYNGGEVVDNPTTYTYNEELTLLPTSKEGYNFVGYSDGNKTFNKIEKGAINDISLKAVFEPKTYTLNFEGLTDSIDVYYNTAIGRLPTLSNNEKWMIDDTIITKDTIWQYLEDKTASISCVDHFIVTPNEEEEVDLNNDIVKDVINNYKVGYTEKYRVDKIDQYKNNPLKISWSNTMYDSSYYFVEIGLKSDLSDKESYVCFEPNLEIDNAYTGATYYYRITAKDSNGNTQEVSSIRSVKTKLTPRLVNMKEISNTRDLGGYETNIKNKKIKQGMVYRGQNIDALENASNSEAKNQFLYEFNIKTDLDVRNAAETKSRTTSPSGCANYIFIEGVYYLGGTTGIDYAPNQERFGNEVKVFANKDNFPLFYHCAIGRDRTGCLGATILAILGVSEKDIYLDYELSMLSYSGTMDNASSSATTGNIKSFMDYMQTNASGTTFNEKIINFLVNKCQVTNDEIKAIQDNLLEDK